MTGKSDKLKSLKDITQYYPYSEAHGEIGMEEDDTGGWIKLKDVEALIQEQPILKPIDYNSFLLKDENKEWIDRKKLLGEDK